MINIYIPLLVNPYTSSSAEANRLVSLINGLIKFNDISIELVMIGGYQSKEEKIKFKANGNINGISYKYLNSLVLSGIWMRRLNNYFLKYLYYYKIKYLITKNLKVHNGIVWLFLDLGLMKIVNASKKNNPKLKIFTELSEFLDIHKYNNSTKLQQKFAEAVEKYFIKNILPKLSGFALMTNTLYQTFKPIIENNTSIIHLPMTVDFERFDGIIDDNLTLFTKPYIVYVGAMNDAKDGVNNLIQAFAKISTKFPKHKLYLIGGWNYDTPAHLEMIKKLNLEASILWLGEFSREKIPAILKNASLLVLSRPDSKQAQGGFPTKLGEYLASGVPVCATTVGEIPNYLTDNESVFFAEPGSVDSFANAMDRALSNPELAQKVGLAGRNIAEIQFNKDIQAQKLYQFLKTL